MGKKKYIIWLSIEIFPQLTISKHKSDIRRAKVTLGSDPEGQTANGFRKPTISSMRGLHTSVLNTSDDAARMPSLPREELADQHSPKGASIRINIGSASDIVECD